MQRQNHINSWRKKKEKGIYMGTWCTIQFLQNIIVNVKVYAKIC
jgi:hypothetical protein